MGKTADYLRPGFTRVYCDGKKTHYPRRACNENAESADTLGAKSARELPKLNPNVLAVKTMKTFKSADTIGAR